MPEAKLAINGGPRAVSQITGHSQPKIWTEELLELLDLWTDDAQTKQQIADLVLQSQPRSPHLFRYYNERSKVVEFETAFKEHFGCRHALGVNSGTSALVAAMVAAGVGPGTEVIVPAYTFFATTSAVVVAKGIPVIAEVDASLTLDPADVEAKITPQTVAIAPVHMGGMPSNMDALMDIARRHNLRVIEDAAQSGGGTYHGKPLGTIGDLGCFSLDYYKTFVAGEGGVVCTDDEWLDTRAQSWHDTAACWRPDRYAKERRPGELFCGENYRMSELAAAVALAQLRKVDQRCADWRRAKQAIISRLQPHPGLQLQTSHDPNGEAAYTFTFFAPDVDTAQKVREALAAEGIGAGGGYSDQIRDWHVYSYWEQIMEQKTATSEGCPFTCPLYQGKLPDYSPDMCPNTLDWLSRAVRMGIDGGWTEGDCEQIAEAINKVSAVYLA
ncbi:MAG: DegT/DnrJ/EryC1/StrS family aminotransferase [Armatimonadia bacterium]